MHVVQGISNLSQPLHSLFCAVQALAWVDHLQQAAPRSVPDFFTSICEAGLQALQRIMYASGLNSIADTPN